MSAARAPLVSAIMPAFNAERFLREAIESVLAQTYPRVECIVVDDGSTDGTGDLARAYGERVRTVVLQDNAGPSAARNAGARTATGTELAFLDADDRWQPDRLTRMLEMLATAGADAVVCAYRVIGEDGTPAGCLRMAPLPTLESMVLFRGSIAGVGSNLLIDRGAFDAVGGFDERLRAGEDWELLTRILASLRLAYVDEPLVDYRRHRGARSWDVDATARNMLRAYEIFFERAGGELGALRRPAYARLHRMLSGSFAEAGRPRLAAVHAVRSVFWDPKSLGEVIRPAFRRITRTR